MTTEKLMTSKKANNVMREFFKMVIDNTFENLDEAARDPETYAVDRVRIPVFVAWSDYADSIHASLDAAKAAIGGDDTWEQYENTRGDTVWRRKGLEGHFELIKLDILELELKVFNDRQKIHADARIARLQHDLALALARQQPPAPPPADSEDRQLATIARGIAERIELYNLPISGDAHFKLIHGSIGYVGDLHEPHPEPLMESLRQLALWKAGQQVAEAAEAAPVDALAKGNGDGGYSDYAAALRKIEDCILALTTCADDQRWQELQVSSEHREAIADRYENAAHDNLKTLVSLYMAARERITELEAEIIRGYWKFDQLSNALSEIVFTANMAMSNAGDNDISPSVLATISKICIDALTTLPKREAESTSSTDETFRLRERIAELEAEVASNLLYDKYESVPNLASQIGQFFDEAGGVNYVEIEMIAQDGRTFTLNIQRNEGKTPHQIITELKAEVARLQEERDSAVREANDRGFVLREIEVLANPKNRREGLQDQTLDTIYRKTVQRPLDFIPSTLAAPDKGGNNE